MRPKLRRAVGRVEKRLVGLTTYVTKDEDKSRQVLREAKVMAHFSAVTLLATAMGWVIYYAMIFLGAQANIAFTVCYVAGAALVFAFKVRLARRHGMERPVTSWLFKFILVYFISFLAGNIIVYIASSFLHDGWAIWFSYPFTFAINSIGTRLVFGD